MGGSTLQMFFCQGLFNIKIIDLSKNPWDSNMCVARLPCQYKCYKRYLSFMRQKVSRFVGYHMFSDVTQLLKVHSLMLKSSPNHIHRLKGTFPHHCLL